MAETISMLRLVLGALAIARSAASVAATREPNRANVAAALEEIGRTIARTTFCDAALERA